MSRYLREVGRRPSRDPLGKAALFSDIEVRRPGTVVLDCSSCAGSTRVSYVDFARASLPFSMWLPRLRGIPFNRRMRCPECHEWTWMRAHWLA